MRSSSASTNRFRRSAFLAFVCAATIAMPATVRAAACVGDPGYPKVPFIDANCDACFDIVDGDDADVSQAELEQAPFSVGGCFVVPASAHVTAKSISWHAFQNLTVLGDVSITARGQDDKIALRANGKVTVGGSLRTSLIGVRTEESNVLPVEIQAANGIELLPKTKVSAKGSISLRVDAGGEIVVGAGTKLDAVKGYVGLAAEARDVYGPWAPPAGRITIGSGTRIKARSGVGISAAGAMDIGNGVSLAVKRLGELPSIALRAGLALSDLDTDLGGDLTIGPKFLVNAPSSFSIEDNGAVHIAPGATLKARNHSIAIAAEHDVVVEAVKALAFDFSASSATGDVRVTGRLNAKPAGAPATFAAPSGTCDVSGFAGLETATLHYDCATVVP